MDSLFFTMKGRNMRTCVDAALCSIDFVAEFLILILMSVYLGLICPRVFMFMHVGSLMYARIISPHWLAGPPLCSAW